MDGWMDADVYPVAIVLAVRVSEDSMIHGAPKSSLDGCERRGGGGGGGDDDGDDGLDCVYGGWENDR